MSLSGWVCSTFAFPFNFTGLFRFPKEEPYTWQCGKGNQKREKLNKKKLKSKFIISFVLINIKIKQFSKRKSNKKF
jgi:hypothetical protein